MWGNKNNDPCSIEPDHVDGVTGDDALAELLYASESKQQILVSEGKKIVLGRITDFDLSYRNGTLRYKATADADGLWGVEENCEHVTIEKRRRFW